jgi:hypothetical protein
MSGNGSSYQKNGGYGAVPTGEGELWLGGSTHVPRAAEGNAG